MPTIIRLKKGLDIKLQGQAVQSIAEPPPAGVFAIKPPDFSGVVPKLLVQPGDEVKAGTPLFYDKRNEAVQYCSPVSGEVAEIVRGDKRLLLEIKILADREMQYQQFDNAGIDSITREKARDLLLQSGCWPLIRQRPYGIVANPSVTPKSIFISAFDTNPLAPNLDFVMEGREDAFAAGLKALHLFTDGNVYLNIHTSTTNPLFTSAKGVVLTTFAGPHPAGNVGVQIHHLNPINKGETVWTVAPQDVAIIGKLFLEGIYDARRVVAITGSQVERPQYYRTFIGSALQPLLEQSGVKAGNNRIAGGGVLSGSKLQADGFVGFYDTQVAVIPEGDEEEFMGWLTPGFQKFSMSHAFFSWLTPNKVHTLTTNLHGEERPFVVTGQYEKVFPMDIYPVQLLKAILIEDVDLMEKLGIYEVVEEDFALCEVVCTSKIPSQHIVSKGIELMRKEFG